MWREVSVRKAHAVKALERARTANKELADKRLSTVSVPDSFAVHLPPALDAEQIVQRVAATALHQAVALTDSRVQPPRAASESELPRGTFSFNLRGSYPGIKATLADTLARTGNATIQSLTLRRDGKSDIEAQVVLSLWLRPVSAAVPVN